jgi:membrane glycosyltransferase
LLRLPNFTAMGRLQLLQAILLFLGAPLYAAILVLAAINAVSGGGAATPMGALALAVFAHWLCYFSPKLSGYAHALIKGEVAARYGGRIAFAKGALAEIAFMQLFEPLSTFNKAIFLASLPFGRRTGWAPQNRAERGIAWGDAARLLWLHTLAGIALTLAFASVSLPALLLALPFTLGMVLALPLCVWSADPALSAWLRARRIAATPEELATS